MSNCRYRLARAAEQGQHHALPRGAHTVGGAEFAAMTQGNSRRRSNGGGGADFGGSAYLSSGSYFGGTQPAGGFGGSVYQPAGRPGGSRSPQQ